MPSGRVLWHVWTAFLLPGKGGIELKNVKSFDDISWGFFVWGSFVSNTKEKDGQGKESGYLLMNVGGRRGAFNIKYDVSNNDLVSALAELGSGSEFLAQVQVSSFRDTTYYSLKDVFAVKAADAVSKMMDSVKAGAKS